MTPHPIKSLFWSVPNESKPNRVGAGTLGCFFPQSWEQSVCWPIISPSYDPPQKLRISSCLVSSGWCYPRLCECWLMFTPLGRSSENIDHSNHRIQNATFLWRRFTRSNGWAPSLPSHTGADRSVAGPRGLKGAVEVPGDPRGRYGKPKENLFLIVRNSMKP